MQNSKISHRVSIEKVQLFINQESKQNEFFFKFIFLHYETKEKF